MQEKVAIPITVKSRIGIDDLDAYEDLTNFINIIANAGCETFILHARKAWLSGLSPKQNRDVPPLRYDVVKQIKRDFPHLNIIINGGISSIAQAHELLTELDGVMIGRDAYHNPYMLSAVDSSLYAQQTEIKSRIAVVEELIPYLQMQLSEGVRLQSMTRHILGLFHGVAGARAWRRHLSEYAPKANADENVVLRALEFVQL